ncbi:MAG: hypothetical protein H0W72_08385 [Planctomycetes bacterium]|nr:hypothetical protein [Planctomycetota bacterium]
MIGIEILKSGFWALLADAGRDRDIRTIARQAVKQATQEFATRTGRESLDFRFSDKAFGPLQLKPRSVKYRKRQTSLFGRALPFTSPRRKVGHMRDLVRLPVAGHRVSNKNGGSGDVVAQLTVTGARILNRRPEYRAEFLNLNRGGRGQDATSARWITGRAIDLMRRYLQEFLTRPRRAKGRA